LPEGEGYANHEWLKAHSVEDRQYQNVIMETVRQKNTLVVLPTALGKTVIALLLAIERTKHGKVYFLAPTKPPLSQAGIPPQKERLFTGKGE